MKDIRLFLLTKTFHIMNIINVSYEHDDYEYNCCRGELWTNTKFIITLQRNPNKYLSYNYEYSSYGSINSYVF